VQALAKQVSRFLYGEIGLGGRSFAACDSMSQRFDQVKRLEFSVGLMRKQNTRENHKLAAFGKFATRVNQLDYLIG
jgi:hypothetical protein